MEIFEYFCILFCNSNLIAHFFHSPNCSVNSSECAASASCIRPAVVQSSNMACLGLRGKRVSKLERGDVFGNLVAILFLKDIPRGSQAKSQFVCSLCRYDIMEGKIQPSIHLKAAVPSTTAHLQTAVQTHCGFLYGD